MTAMREIIHLMAPSPAFIPLTSTEILDRLTPSYGVTEWRPHGDATAELVLTLLSQNTADTNSGRAFARLLERFPTWQAVIDAPLPDVEDAIRPGGLAPTKAPRLQQLLREVQSRAGGFDLSFLKEMPLEEARQWLRTLPAVGPKTAACVLVFALGMPALPVDTHVHRVAGRLGLASPKLTPEKVQTLLEVSVPADDQFLFHVMLIRHGRHTCFAQRPACGRCPLLDRCPAGQEFIGGNAQETVLEP
jgi:endonuclease-3